MYIYFTGVIMFLRELLDKFRDDQDESRFVEDVRKVKSLLRATKQHGGRENTC